LGKAEDIVGLILVMVETAGRRMEKIQAAVDTPDPDRSIFIHQEASDEVACQGGRIFFAVEVLDEDPFLLIKKDQAMLRRAEQKVAQAILFDHGDPVIPLVLGEAGRIPVAPEDPALPVEQIEAVLCRHPAIAPAVFIYIIDMVIAEAFGTR
jgi:hypothetical protein